MSSLGFTPASEQDIFRIENTNMHRTPTASTLSGEEARQFYENLMKGGDRQAASRSADGRESQTRQMNRESSRSRRKRRRVRAAELQRSQTVSVADGRVNGETPSIQSGDAMLQGLRLLRCAHEGDISGLKVLLSNGVDINFQDTFMWTAIMCASWSGQRGAVKLLLQQGAPWVGVVDMQGRDARDLAMEAGHSGVLEELEGYGESPQRDTQADNSVPQSHWCDVCRNEYSSDLSSHLSSTVHQFSLRRPPPTPYYCLPPSSNSYKMMVRCGWKPGSGLGPEGEGPTQPVSTVLKRDHKGLGYGQTKRAKVTHFQARDHEAVKRPSEKREERAGRGQRKEEGRRKEQRDRNWERDFRTSFYL